MSERLFGPAPFPDPRRRARDTRPRRARRTPPDVVTVILGRNDWTLTEDGRRPVAHAMRQHSSVSACGRAVVRLTFEHGTKAAACPECLKAGAVA